MVVARKASMTTKKRKEGLQSENLRAKSMSTIGNSIQMTLATAWEKNLTCKRCKKKGHTRRTCPQSKKKTKKAERPEEQADLADEYPHLSMTSNGTRKMITTVMIMILILMILTLQCHHLHLHPLHCHLVIT
jgi:hypothetical protein